MKISMFVTTLLAGFTQAALAQPVVTTTADAGPGSLRAAIEWANGNPGLDTITFAIPGAGPQTIELSSPLPTITDPVVIDGYTQPGASPNTLTSDDNAVQLIELSGAAIPDGTYATGLTLNASGCVVRGLVINRFNGAGIHVSNNIWGIVIEGNFIGTSASGTDLKPNAGTGIELWSSLSRVGGTSPGQRNLISANGSVGIAMTYGYSNMIQGNFIGTDAHGRAGLGNGQPGVWLAGVGHSSTYNLIGGTTPGAGNLISGNRDGVVLQGGAAVSNTIAGNVIGMDISGIVGLGNAVEGVLLFDGPSGNCVGGTAPGAGNTIAYNGRNGVRIVDAGSRNNVVLGNRIFGNRALGISFGTGDGFTPTPNDLGDADAGPNDLQNFPLLSSAFSSGGNVLVAGSLDSLPSRVYRIELFANSADNPSPSGYCQGERFAGSTEVTTDSAGRAHFAVSLPATTGTVYYTATATDTAARETSEFSSCAALSQCNTRMSGMHPNLGIERVGAEVILRWSGSGFVVQSADEISGPWVDRALGTSPDGTQFEARIVAEATKKFFRLHESWQCPDSSAAMGLVYSSRVLPGDLDDPEVPVPTLTWFDSSANGGPSQMAWSFHFGGDRPVDILVSLDGTQILQVVQNGPENSPTHTTTPSYVLDDGTGVPRFVSFTPPLVLSVAGLSNEQAVASEFFRTYPWMFGTGDPARQLQLDRVEPDLDGGKHVVFKQLYGGLSVWGCQLAVHVDSHLAITSISGRYLREPGVDLIPAVSQADAYSSAVQQWIQANGGDQLNPGETIEQLGLVIMPVRLADPSAQNDIAWWFRFPDADRFVAAHTGTNIVTCSRREYLRQVYDLKNQFWVLGFVPGMAELELQDGQQVTPNPLDPESLPADMAIVGVQSFWRDFMHRNSWDGAGASMRAMVNASFDIPFTPQNEDGNSSWNGFYTSFSRGFAEPDVVAHEFTHALTEATANLVYAFEPGALNESFSDVFGKLIFPTPSPWMIGSSSVSRDLKNPSVGNYSGFVIMPNTFAGDFGGVHVNSGIGNRAAVLLSDGDGSAAHPGIGRGQLARIWWDTLTTRLTPWSTYADLAVNAWEVTRELAATARSGVLVPAPGRPGSFIAARTFTQADPQEVLWAFSQVGIDLRLQYGWFTLPSGQTSTLEFNKGMFTLCPNQSVRDVVVKVYRQPVVVAGIPISVPGTGLMGELRVSNGTTSGSFDGGAVTAAITKNGVGTPSLEVDVTATTANYSEPQIVPPAYTYSFDCGSVSMRNETPSIHHWFDNPLGLGRKYGDIIDQGAMLPSGCSVVGISLELMDEHGQVLATTSLGNSQATDGHRGAWIFSDTVGGRSLEVHVHSWHDFGWSVRYRLVYSILGNNCSLPPTTVREVGPDNL